MNVINAFANAVITVFDSLVPKGSGQAYAATLRMDVNDYRSAEEKPSVGGYLHVACHAPASYVGVFVAFTERPVSPSSYGKLKWTCIGNHDSCWRDSIESSFPKAHRELLAFAEKHFGRPAKELSEYQHLEEVHIASAADILGEALQSNRRPKAFDLSALLESMPRR